MHITAERAGTSTQQSEQTGGRASIAWGGWHGLDEDIVQLALLNSFALPSPRDTLPAPTRVQWGGEVVHGGERG